MSENDIETINTFNEIINDIKTIDVINKSPQTYQQSGGGFADAVLAVSTHIMDVVKRVLSFIFKDLLFDQIFILQDTFKRKSNRSGLWKYIVWSAKCGCYLLIFAIAGPIFILIGISMVYSKLFKKITEDPNATPESFVRGKLAEAQV